MFGLQFSDPVSVGDPSVLCSAVAERWYLSEEVTKMPLREGRIRGMLFTPKGFYPTALKGCWGIVFTHGVRMDRRAGGGKKFVRAVSQKP